MLYQNLELISHHLCPYVQRSVITLTEKNIAHKRVYIDLSNKPDWFLKVSPTGKVPLLKVDDTHILFESAVICEFIDEVTPGSLHDDNPVIKAKHRAWNEFASQILNNIGAIYNASDEKSLVQQCQSIREKFKRLEAEVALPFFAGANFCMVDAAFGPAFRYFDTMEKFLPLDVFAGLDRVTQWRSTLANRASIKHAVAEDYPELLEDFILRRNSYLSQLIETL